MIILSGIITVSFGIYLISLLIISILRKDTAISYFSSFASSAKAHYFEQALRLLVGWGLLMYSENMHFSFIFYYFGWLLIATTVVLIITPWRWHHRYGKWAIPLTIKYLKIYAIAACLLGFFILYCVIDPIIK